MSHLHCAFTLRTEWKHQSDTYLVNIHWVDMKYCLVFLVCFFLLCLVMADDGHFGRSICGKNFNTFTKRYFWQNTGRNSFRGFQNCHFHVFATFSNSSQRPSWTAQWHIFERILFADNSDWIWLKSVQYFLRYLAFWQNWTRNQEAGHCDLILQQILFTLIILKTKVPLLLHIYYRPNIRGHSGEKLILLVLLFLALVAILDSQPPWILSFWYPCSLVMLQVKVRNHGCIVFREKAI